MDTNVLLDARCAVICAMLFSTIVAVTAEEPATVPPMFLKMWMRYQRSQESKRNRPSGQATERFWEIDMTKFEP